MTLDRHAPLLGGARRIGRHRVEITDDEIDVDTGATA
jgi:hypothetical protein